MPYPERHLRCTGTQSVPYEMGNNLQVGRGMNTVLVRALNSHPDLFLGCEINFDRPAEPIRELSLLEIAIMRPDSRARRSSLPVPRPPKPKAPAAAPSDVANEPPRSLGHWFSDQIAWLTSMVVHTALILFLAIITFSGQISAPTVILANSSDDAPPTELIPPSTAHLVELKLPRELVDYDEPVISSASPSVESIIEDVIKDLDKRHDGNIICWWKPDKPAGGDPGDHDRGPLTTRKDRRCYGDWPNGHGPTAESESAVDAALKWLAEHQSADGSWSFEHRDGLCQGRCTNPGSMKAAKNAATAMALMTFLGAGQSHVEGRYKENVAKGLRFLLAALKQEGRVGSWHEAVGNATNYSHGMACLAVCEAYAMARDHKPRKGPARSPSEMTEEERRRDAEEKKRAKRLGIEVPLAQLRTAAQSSLNYIMQNQHSAGGWRYNTGQPGDTSVVGWMIMALKSGHMASLTVSPRTVVSAGKFLDSVKHDDYGSIYHYLPDKNRPLEACKATTAIGLLCRMYMGWDRNHPGILQGVQQLGAWGPDLSADGRAANMYYNYYATQVMFHHGGEPWKKWNNSLRDRLVAAQAKDGHARGSWHFNGDHGTAVGGRLYSTALAAMTLEVYYRYMPIYKSKSTEGGIE